MPPENQDNQHFAGGNFVHGHSPLRSCNRHAAACAPLARSRSHEPGFLTNSATLRVDAMADKLQLNHPWFVAVWPGMGHVALNAGVYLLAKLGMNVVAEYEASGLFDVDHVEVKDGLIQPLRQPRNRF